MPPQEVLILAMTRMLSGICTAGVTQEPDPVSGLRWVRPVREFGTLLPGDMTDANGRLVQCCDVVELDLLAPRPDPPHVEDWLADFVHHRPRLLRRLEGEKRVRFFANYCDGAPQDIIVHHTRSLCIVRPDQVSARFSLDPYSGKYTAHVGFSLTGTAGRVRTTRQHDAPVTDLKWLALGRAWLARDGTPVSLDHGALLRRLGADAIYLALGLSRSWQGKYWLLAVGVHTVPDYESESHLELALGPGSA
jgi:hypothetical protein